MQTKAYYFIELYCENKRIGYVKSVSYKKGTFEIARTLKEAKKYRSEQAAFSDSDEVTSDIVAKFGFMKYAQQIVPKRVQIV